MKQIVHTSLILLGFISLSGCGGPSDDPSSWSRSKLDKWFEEGQWMNGLDIKPDASIDRRALAVAYFKDPGRWDKAFEFMKSRDLENVESKRYDIDGDNLFATVSEYTTVGEDEKHYEAHRKYIDIQYVVRGEEMIGVSPLSDTTQTFQPYDRDKDIGFYEVSPVKKYEATPETFFIFFPSDAHEPGLDPGERGQVKKLVIKVRTE